MENTTLDELAEDLYNILNCKCGKCVYCLIDFIHDNIEDENEANKQIDIIAPILFSNN